MKRYTINEFIAYTKEHPNDWINYCEILVLRNGLILLARPSHTECAITYAMEQENKTRDQINEELCKDLVGPLSYYVDKYDMMAVWYERILISEDAGVNRFQKHVIEMLRENGLVSNVLDVAETAEYRNYLRRRDLESQHELL